jgi:hypothetical protein
MSLSRQDARLTLRRTNCQRMQTRVCGKWTAAFESRGAEAKSDQSITTFNTGCGLDRTTSNTITYKKVRKVQGASPWLPLVPLTPKTR